MYMQMVWMLTFGCIAVEGFFAWNVPQWRKFTERTGKTGKILDLLFSFFLSWILGTIFQAPSGLVIFMSAVLSTILSMPMYPVLNWAEEHQEEIKKYYQKAREVMIDTIVLCYKILRLMTIPIRAGRTLTRQYKAVKIALRREEVVADTI